MNNSQWSDPRFLITLLLICLFGYAYADDPSDQAMKGAIIAAFSAAYGFWLGSKGSEKATENTGKAFDAIRAAQESAPPAYDPNALKSGDTVQIDKSETE